MDSFTPETLTYLSPMGIILVFAIKSYFDSQKAKTTENKYTTKELCNEKHNGWTAALEVIQKQAETQNNHLHTIEKDMGDMKARLESEIAGINSSLSLLVKKYLEEK